jgi:hypothetical protein
MKTLHLQAIALPVFGLLTFTAYSQLEFGVKCYPSSLDLYNGVYLDGEVIEYACVADPAFYVTVYDPAACDFWGTNYMGANPDHDFSNYETGRPRVEKYFVFRYANADELNGMNEMLQQIPDGYPYAIYTPGGYSYTQVHSVSPVLAETLADYWVLAGFENMMVLYDVKGDPAARTSTDNLNAPDPTPHIHFTAEISCQLGVEESTAAHVAVHYAGKPTLPVSRSGPCRKRIRCLLRRRSRQAFISFPERWTGSRGRKR